MPAKDLNRRTMLGLMTAGPAAMTMLTQPSAAAEPVEAHLVVQVPFAVVATDDLDAVRTVLAEEGEAVALIFVETPANPLLGISDLAALADLAAGLGVPLACDSTSPRRCSSGRWTSARGWSSTAAPNTSAAIPTLSVASQLSPICQAISRSAWPIAPTTCWLKKDSKGRCGHAVNGVTVPARVSYFGCRKRGLMRWVAKESRQTRWLKPQLTQPVLS